MWAGSGRLGENVLKMIWMSLVCTKPLASLDQHRYQNSSWVAGIGSRPFLFIVCVSVIGQDN